MATAELNGTTIYYEVRGSGPPCLAMHGGLGFDHQYLAGSLQPLEKRMRVIYYDHRCNGRSARSPLASLTMEQLADDAAALMDVLGFGDAVVLGHSYGGFVAQELALRRPERVRGLVLVDTTPGQLGSGESEEGQGPPMPAEMEALMTTVPATPAEMAQVVEAMMPFYLHHLHPSAVRALIADTEFAPEAMVRGFEVLGGWSAVDRLGRLHMPALLLWGEHDLVCSLPQAHRIARRLPNAELVVFANSGHFPWLEEPAAFFDALGSWLSRLDAGHQL